MGDGVPTSRAGSQFGPYLLRRLIDRGVMGEAYEAEDTRRDRTVALKLFPEAFSQDPMFRERLQREARSIGRLDEPHIVDDPRLRRDRRRAVRGHALDRRHSIA